MAIAAGSHPFPSRTRKLRLPAPMVLGGRPPGRVGRRRISHNERPQGRSLHFCPSRLHPMPPRGVVVCSGSHSGCEHVVGASPRPISTSQLHPLRGFHSWPINPIVSRGPYPRKGGGRPHLGTSFPLRCLQRLSLPNIANQPCPWQDNWHTRGPSVPVLSY